jgi:hypothetical protein
MSDKFPALRIETKSSQFEVDAVMAGWNDWSLSDRLEYVLAYKHFSLESGCDAHVMLNKMLPIVSKCLSEATARERELEEKLEMAVKALADIHSTTSQIKFSWFKDKPDFIKQAVGDVHQFAEIAFSRLRQRGALRDSAEVDRGSDGEA